MAHPIGEDLPLLGPAVSDVSVVFSSISNPTPQLLIQGSTHIGKTRKENQDVAAIFYTPFGAGFVLCDGMGGMEKGGMAAMIAVKSFLSYIGHIRLDKPYTPESSRALLSAAVAVANQSVWTQFRGRGGTTLAAVMVDKYSQATCAHVGDSRIYRQNKARDQVLRTVDHTIRGMVERSTGEAAPDASTSLIQCIGTTPGDLEVAVETIPALWFPCIMGTSDGVHDYFPVEHHITDGAARIVTQAVEQSGHDNTTAVTLVTNDSLSALEFPLVPKLL
jgi:serine/threonine protein phosphatase PrpC